MEALAILVSAAGSGHAEGLPLYNTLRSFLGTFAMIVLVISVILFIISAFISEEKKKSQIKKVAFALVVLTCLLIVLYLLSPLVNILFTFGLQLIVL